MALLQCEMCCGELEISTDKSVGVCKYCGSTFTIPKEIEKKGNLFNRASYLRQSCNFDKAISVYESILADNCEDADALWGLVLCRYGIEFVEDPKTHSRIPTCHRASRTSILLDPDFKSALKYADEEKRNVYYNNAQQIDQIQKAILHMSDTQEKYDVFICYKETDDSGERTVDSVLAQELYNELKKMKIKTFFARKTLEGKAGSNYEPIIYSALNSAKIMIVLGTKPEYFEATWVKNEWSRYLDFMKDSDEKHLIPVYKDMSAYQLPEEFMSVQALDMSRIGFMLDLCDGVKKLLKKDKSSEETGNSSISKESLYSRAMVFLGNREFYKAVDYFDKVLDIDPKYSRAYWGSLLASYQCISSNELINCAGDDWTEDARLRNALQFSSEEERKIYEDTLERRIANFKRLANAALESKDFDKCQAWCDKYIQQDACDGSVWWVKLLAKNQSCNSNTLFDKCLGNTVSIIDTEEYQNAIKYSIEEESMMYQKTANKIQRAVEEKKRTLTYDDCKSYMVNTIETLKRTKKIKIADQWKHYSEEADALKALRNHNGKFYRNNIFVFLLQILIWAVPSYVVVAYFLMNSGNTNNFFKIFGIAFGILMAFVIFVNICKYPARSKQVQQLIKNCDRIASVLKDDRESISLISVCEHKAEALLKKYLNTSDFATDEVYEIRTEFDSIYEGLVQNVK